MRIAYPLLALVLGSMPALAQDTPEARLREMLRRTTAELRATQDSQALLQASLDQEKQKTAALQQQLDAIAARPAEKPSISEDELVRVRAEAQAKITSLEASVKQWQGAYQKAAELARAKDAESKIAAARATESERQAGVCTAANTKLMGIANDILHLYRTQNFRSLLLASYEPLLGLKKVELENTIQDYEERILDQRYRPGRAPAKTEAPR